MSRDSNDKVLPCKVDRDKLAYNRPTPGHNIWIHVSKKGGLAQNIENLKRAFMKETNVERERSYHSREPESVSQVLSMRLAI